MDDDIAVNLGKHGQAAPVGEFDVLKVEYKGTTFRIVHCCGAIESFNTQSQYLSPKNKINSIRRALISLIKRLSNGERLSKDSFPIEGDLPKRAGQDNGRFYAFKKIPMRAYVWLSKKHKSTYFISHYIYKDYEKLKSQQVDIVGGNWIRIEEIGDER